VPKKKKSTESTNQTAPDLDAPSTTKKTGKPHAPRRATRAKKPRKASSTRNTSEGTAHISAFPQAEVTHISGEPSDDTVRLRAYYISERRRRFALPGDAESDWLEAKRQLLAEARR
jgi:Protein of unknown function (DUF2934)